MKKKKILFIDRDGVLIQEPDDKQIDSFQKLCFVPGVFTWLRRIVEETNYRLVMVTNQDGLGTISFPEENFWPVHNLLLQTLAGEGIVFDAVHIDKSLPQENLPTRKPGIGMLTTYLNGDDDLENSYVIGDRLTDVQLAQNLGCRAILLNASPEVTLSGALAEVCSLRTDSWEAVYRQILPKRQSTQRRKTNETDIIVAINLDGTGKANISTGIGFFDHMLEQLARHGGMDIDVSVQGDLHIDEHHTIEDTGLALGACFLEALSDKRGIERYGFCLPMDDCLAQVAIDFGGRPWLLWEADFKREKIGEMPTEMFFHFFKSFSDTAKCNLNIKASGTNEHHKIEAIFKAFSKAAKNAVRKDYANPQQLPTTKGSL